MVSDDPAAGWTPLRHAGMPRRVRDQFQSEFPIGSEIRDWLIKEFESQCSITFEPLSWADDELRTFRKWWCFQLENGSVSMRRYPRLEHLLHASLSAKASALAQRHCHICSGMLSHELQFPVAVLPIRLAPESRQALNKIDWAAFQRAVATWWKGKTLDLGLSKHVCIAVTYVLTTDRKRRDLDNMTKAIMDAFSRAVGFDDKDIHHLDVLKLIGQVPEEYMFIRTAPSHLQDCSTVMVPSFEVNWAGQEKLNLADYRT